MRVPPKKVIGNSPGARYGYGMFTGGNTSATCSLQCVNALTVCAPSVYLTTRPSVCYSLKCVGTPSRKSVRASPVISGRT